jgi:hypothetical protein
MGSNAIDRTSYEDFLRAFPAYLAANRPVVVEAPPELMARSWEDESIVDLLGEQPLPVMTLEGGLFGGRNERGRKEVQVATYLELLRRDPSRYFLPATSVTPYPRLAEAIGMPAPLRAALGADPEATNYWLCGRGPLAALHFDPLENLNVQLRGRKRFVLFPPGLPEIAPRSPFTFAGHYARHASLDEMPSAARAAAERAQVEFVLQAGEMLYLPFAWWHQVQSLDEVNSNANYWWMAGRPKLLAHPRQVFSAALTKAYRIVRGIAVV